jgi:hypothetical protein
MVDPDPISVSQLIATVAMCQFHWAENLFRARCKNQLRTVKAFAEFLQQLCD